MKIFRIVIVMALQVAIVAEAAGTLFGDRPATKNDVILIGLMVWVLLSDKLDDMREEARKARGE